MFIRTNGRPIIVPLVPINIARREIQPYSWRTMKATILFTIFSRMNKTLDCSILRSHMLTAIRPAL